MSPLTASKVTGPPRRHHTDWLLLLIVGAALIVCTLGCSDRNRPASGAGEYQKVSLEQCTVRVPSGWDHLTVVDPQNKLLTLQLKPDPKDTLIFLNIRKHRDDGSYDEWKRISVGMIKQMRKGIVDEKSTDEVSKVTEVEGPEFFEVFLDDNPRAANLLPTRDGFIVGKPGSKVPLVFPYTMQLPKRDDLRYHSLVRSFEDVVHSVRLRK